ncbi:MAG: ATP12 family chaperone protein [Pseudomonadota bacterium]
MKRFWKTAAAAPLGEAFTVRLDDRPVRTPKRRELVVPTAALAALLAEEWQAQGETVDADGMHLNRLATSVVDLMPERRRAALEQLLDYARSDLLCYRASGPKPLLDAYERHWTPALTWLETTLGVRLRVIEGLMPEAQPETAIRALAAVLESRDDWHLVGLHALATTTGSLVLALMVEAGRLEGGAAAGAALVDEHFQRDRWGEEAEALARERRLRAEVEAAARYLRALD